VNDSIRKLRLRYARWQRYRRTLSELNLMTDRDLADIGIKRWDVERIAREAASLPG
jgi:uncharacterized protein YjiS (DUF1127 family)